MFFYGDFSGLIFPILRGSVNSVSFLRKSNLFLDVVVGCEVFDCSLNAVAMIPARLTSALALITAA